ncbi:hypothetical protein BH11BAC3_BH11BAC3_19580 [soil metagenome]
MTNKLLATIKRKIVVKIDRLLTHTSAYSDLNEMKKSLKRVIILNYEIMPEILPLEERAAKIFTVINSTGQYKNVPLQISKDDLMFQFWLYHTGAIDAALHGYFSSGYRQADTVKLLLNKYFSKTANISLLDFASGHGRVSRYFRDLLPQEQITIAEIKTGAVEFQKKQFNYKGFVSSANPTDMNCTEQFDFILCSSLFTHLDKQLFAHWLQTLGALIKLNGILCISIHHFLPSEENLFNYTTSSEEDIFTETSGSLVGKNIYGLTRLSRKAFIELINQWIPYTFKILDETPWESSQTLISIGRIS